MDKEQLVRQLKYTKEKHKNDKLYTFDTDISAMCYDVLDVLSRCVEIPYNATNGEVIKAIFPNTQIRENKSDFIEYTLDGIVGTCVEKDWWNSLYK